MKKYSAVLLLVLLLAGAFPAGAEANLTNIALHKPVTAGNYSASHPKGNLVDGNSDTYINETGVLTDNESGTASDFNLGDNWYQIDLEKNYYFDHIILRDDTAFWGSVYNIRILASRHSDFSEKTTLFESGEFEEVSLPLTVSGDGEAYRYVRLEKVNSSMNLEYAYTELEVWADESEVEEEPSAPILENVAKGKPVTAGRYIDVTTKDDINDGNENTGIYYVPTGNKTDNPDGVLAEPQNDWSQIDMGEPYLIDHIVLKRDKENWMTALCFQIMVSNSPDFSDGTAVVLFEVGESPAAVFPLTVAGDGNYYRYVRLQRTGMTSYERYTELEVWSSGALRTKILASTIGNQTMLLSFDRAMDFSMADTITVVDDKSGKTVSYTVSITDNQNLQLVFPEEMNGKTITVTLPAGMQSEDGIALNNQEVSISFPEVLLVENFTFTDENGNPITTLAGATTLGISAEVVNRTQALTESCVLILALYQGDNMVSVSDIRLSVAGGERRTVTLEKAISQLGADSAAVYIWNNYTEALTVSQTCEIND